MKTTTLHEQVTIGPQPSDGDLRDLPEMGFRSVVNFRNVGEDAEQLAPDTEGDLVRGMGLEYLHIPVSMKAMAAEAVDQFRAQYRDLPKPVFAHCKSAKRAGAMVLLHMAIEQGLTGEQTLQQADQLGLGWEQPELRSFVKNFVNGHCQKP